jgi:hypothetical protein
MSWQKNDAGIFDSGQNRGKLGTLVALYGLTENWREAWDEEE